MTDWIRRWEGDTVHDGLLHLSLRLNSYNISRGSLAFAVVLKAFSGVAREKV